MDTALSSIKAAAAEAGVGQQSIVFGEQAQTDRNGARYWLAAVIELGICSALAVWRFLLSWTSSAETAGEIVREIGGRFTILTLLAFALGFTVRQYTSSKHNEKVNLHRQNALRTFEPFVNAANDQEIKDAVLLEATRAIFAPQSSGFLRGRTRGRLPGHDN